MARDCLRSFLRHEDSVESDAGGELIADFLIVVTNFLTKK